MLQISCEILLVIVLVAAAYYAGLRRGVVKRSNDKDILVSLVTELHTTDDLSKRVLINERISALVNCQLNQDSAADDGNVVRLRR